ncbi:MAG TPA: dephospho-CoA kinase [Anaerolineaceae bacterium]|nr:dephospho-CoA kinase [Anaerolineaceae bacterium]
MSKWPGKYVIGITGNIATGKSVVRKMLEHLGAYGIDADALAHRAIAKGAPGYRPVVEMFGRWILDSQQQIDRSRLGRVVFSDPQALTLLEGIVHPLVSQAIDLIVSRSTQKVVVIEAIKLLEAGIARDCDTVWVSYSPPEIQLARLKQNRKMSEAEARQRILSQSSQDKKLSHAKIVIKNLGSFEDTWRQVLTGWQVSVPTGEPAPTQAKPVPPGRLNVQRGGPRHSEDIASLFTRLSGDGRMYSKSDIMAAFGEKAFMLLQKNDVLVGLVGWQVENLIARTTDILLDPSMSPDEALPVLMKEVELASKDLQSEASLVFVSSELAKEHALWQALGYNPRSPQSLGVQAWQEAALETMPPGSVLLFKQLRVDRVLRPI